MLMSTFLATFLCDRDLYWNATVRFGEAPLTTAPNVKDSESVTEATAKLIVPGVTSTGLLGMLDFLATTASDNEIVVG